MMIYLQGKLYLAECQSVEAAVFIYWQRPQNMPHTQALQNTALFPVRETSGR